MIDETTTTSDEKNSLNFIEQMVEADLRNQKNDGVVYTRFPPEPNGYLHIGHAKSIVLNFELAKKYGGKTNLRFDDTNPTSEDVEYVDSIKHDVEWLGYKWEDSIKFASDYFDQLYQWAVQLIKQGKAYVDDQTAEQISATRGTPTEPGTESPYRNRTVEENLDLFERMKNGEFADGSRVLRAKTGMTSPNMHMRDPVMYRISHTPHHRTGTKWKIYPMYDYAHGQSDYIEGITHSICTLEFENHRPLYNWFLDQVADAQSIRPQQIEFARLNLSYTVMSKRKLLQLVKEKIVSGWDDPRMPTISGLRRRGYTPEAIRNFAQRIGVAKRNNVIDVGLLEFSVREHLNISAPRVMAVLDPVKLVITNFPQGKTEMLRAENNPEDPNAGWRELPFSGELYIERDDFKEHAPNRKYFRLALGKEVRLKNAYIIKAEHVLKDAQGNITEIQCTYEPESRSGSGTEASKRKVKGTLHWVSAQHAVEAEVRIYDRLFNNEAPDGHKENDFKNFLNAESLTILNNAKVEPSLLHAKNADRFQFQRLGYFAVDKDSTPNKLVFNRTVTLKDTWAKIANQQ